MNVTSVNSAQQTEQQNELVQQEQFKEQDESFNFQAQLNALLLQNNINLSTSDQNLLLNTAQETGELNLKSTKLLDWAKDLNDIKSSFNYNTMTMDKDDAVFFANLTENIPAQVSLNNGEVEVKLAEMAETSDIQKSVKTSKILTNIIENCMKTQQSARIDFDNNISVIMKIDKEGKVSAEFIPSDKVAEQYLKDNIAFLRQTFDEQHLAYNELTYREQNKNRNSNNRNKDKENE